MLKVNIGREWSKEKGLLKLKQNFLRLMEQQGAGVEEVVGDPEAMEAQKVQDLEIKI